MMNTYVYISSDCMLIYHYFCFIIRKFRAYPRLGRAQVVKISLVSSSCTEPSDVVHFQTGAQTTRLRRFGWTVQTAANDQNRTAGGAKMNILLSALGLW